MIHIIKKFIYWKIIIISVLLISSSVGADDSLEMLPIKSVPDIKAPSSQSERKLQFHGGGIILRIGDDEGRKLIVINDLLRYFAPVVTYYNSVGVPISPNQFYKGKIVGYFLNEKREITSLYLTK